jgi:hypothetical protein
VHEDSAQRCPRAETKDEEGKAQAAVSIAVRRQAKISAINVSPINRIEKLSGWAKNQKIFER